MENLRKNNVNYLVITLLLFFVFVGFLYNSYLHKLGYLNKSTYFFLFLILATVLLIIIKESSFLSKSFWIFIFASFLYALTDKYYRIHIKLSRYFHGSGNLTAVIMVNIIYIVIFITILLLFYKFFINELKKNPYWVFLFIFAIVLKIVSVFSDLVFHDITEDYLELFSLFFFFSSFFSVFILNNEDNKNENRNFPSTN